MIQSDSTAVDCIPARCLVSNVRFASATVGYLFGPALFETHDGGRTWKHVSSPPVEALEPSDGTVVRVVYDHSGCPGPCERTVQEAAAGSNSWRTLLHISPGLGDSRQVLAQVIRQGSKDIYVPIYGDLAAGIGTQHTIIFRSTDAGATWSRLADPCGTGHDSIDLAAAAGGFLAALCVPRAGSGQVFVLTSTDFGSSWLSPRKLPGGSADSMNMITAASDTRLAVGTSVASGNGPSQYDLLTSQDGGRQWVTAVAGVTQIAPDEPGVGWLRFVDPVVGYWVSGPQTIWTTDDGGARWTRLPLR